MTRPRRSILFFLVAMAVLAGHRDIVIHLEDMVPHSRN